MPPVSPMVISIYSDESIGGGLAAANATSHNNNFGVNASNDSYFVPFQIDAPFTVRSVGIHISATSSGNLDVGVYSEGGTKIWSAGSTAMGSTNAFQLWTPTAFTLPPGRYYMAVGVNNTTGTFRIQSVGEVVRSTGLLGGTTFPLPSSMSGAVAVSSSFARLPIIFISQRVVM